MKNLFLFVNYAASQHFVILLELIKTLQEQGHENFLLADQGVLKYASYNPYNLRAKSVQGRARMRKGLALVDFPNDHIMWLNRNLETHNFPKKIQSSEELENFSLYGVDFGQAVHASMVSLFRDHRFDIHKLQAWILDVLWSSILIYESTVKTIKTLKPTTMYIYNSRLADSRPALRACQQLGVPYFVYEMSGNVYTYETHPFDPHSPSIVGNKIQEHWQHSLDANKEEIGASWFTKQRNGPETGNWSYLFIHRQRKGILPNDLDFSKKNVAIFNSSLDEFEGFPEWQTGLYNDEFAAVALLLKAFQHRNDITFYLRAHPHLSGRDNTQMRELKNLSCKNLKIIWPEETVDTYALIEAVDTVMVFRSTVGVEASFWRKPVILLGRALYESLDCVYRPSSYDQVIDLINAKLDPKPLLGALKYGYWESTKGKQFKHFQPAGMDGDARLSAMLEPKLSLVEQVMQRVYWKLDGKKGQ